MGPVCRIVLLVRDFEASCRFYGSALGLEAIHFHDGGWAEFDGGGVRVCLRSAWDGMPFDANDFGRSPDEVLFRVENLRAEIARLRDAGVEVGDPHAPGPGIEVAELADPDGRRIGLEQRTP